MTTREHRLRVRIDQLADERDDALRLVARLVGRKQRSAYRRCGFCGTPCYGPACLSHRDLLDIERELYIVRTTTEAAAPLTGSPAASATQGG